MADTQSRMTSFHIPKEGIYENNGWIFEIEKFSDKITQFPKDDENAAYVDLSSVVRPFNFEVRGRKDGDIITPFGLNGSQKLKKYLNTKKIPNHEKDNLVFLTCGNEILWAIGLGISDKIKVTKNPTHRLKYYKKREIKLEDLKVLFSEEQLQTRLKELANEMNEFYNGEEVIAICVLKGAVMFAVDLVKNLNMPLKMEFIRLSSYGSSTTTSGKVNAVDIKLPDLNGKNVLIIEDIVDTGLTAKFLIDFMAINFHVKSLKFCSLLDKKMTRKVDVEPDYYGFDVDDKFVVGYGLDYDGYFRNLRYIGYKEV